MKSFFARLLSFSLAFILMLSLIACKKEKESEGSNEKKETVATTTAVTTTAVTTTAKALKDDSDSWTSPIR